MTAPGHATLRTTTRIRRGYQESDGHGAEYAEERQERGERLPGPSGERIAVTHAPVDLERLAERHETAVTHAAPHTRVVYVTGSLFFANVSTFLDTVRDVPASDHLVVSLRGMPAVDHMGVEAIREAIDRQCHGGGDVHLAGVQPAVLEELSRTGVLDYLGRQRVHWSADRAILAVRREEGICPTATEDLVPSRLLRDRQPA